MCSSPKVPEPTQYQAQKAPVYESQANKDVTTGRRGTMLTGGSGVVNSPSGVKKTQLGL